MHEMSLAEGVLQLIEDSARTPENFSRVKTVWLEIGRLAGVDAKAMRVLFERFRGARTAASRGMRGWR